LAADSPSNYLGAGLGVYFPESNDMKGFDAGFNGDARRVGASRVHPGE
jgi:hypothetical protein